MSFAGTLLAQSPTPALARGARTVVYHPRDLVPVRAKLHYTTLIVLPEGEEVVARNGRYGRTNARRRCTSDGQSG